MEGQHGYNPRARWVSPSSLLLSCSLALSFCVLYSLALSPVPTAPSLVERRPKITYSPYADCPLELSPRSLARSARDYPPSTNRSSSFSSYKGPHTKTHTTPPIHTHSPLSSRTILLVLGRRQCLCTTKRRPSRRPWHTCPRGARRTSGPRARCTAGSAIAAMARRLAAGTGVVIIRVRAPCTIHHALLL